MTEREYIGPNGERRCPMCDYQTPPLGKYNPSDLRGALKRHMMAIHDQVYAEETINKLEREAGQ